METGDNVLEIKNLVKVFPGVRAVDDVSFDIKRNTIHCLVGENGAGKSTLIKILTGAYEKTSGTIFLNGKEYVAHNTNEARESGVSTLFQELNVVDQLTVEENLTLGKEKTKLGFFTKDDSVKKTLEILKTLEPSINPKSKTSSLSVAKKQVIEIAKAVASESDILIMDEPTAALSEVEIERLFKIIKSLKDNNVTVIYISHRLDEIFEIGDFVTVMRDGGHIGTMPLNEVENRGELIKMMVGKAIREEYVPNTHVTDETILKVENITNHKLRDVSCEVKRGEIVGFYGLIGGGKTELARAIYGVDSYRGNIYYKGEHVSPNPAKSIELGIALVPEERRTQGIFSILTIKYNIPVMRMSDIATRGVISSVKEKDVADKYVEDLSISTNTIEKDVGLLSGGNQQKVVFSKCLFAQAELLMLDEPTRGIDVGAKSEIYSIIRQLSKEGNSIMIFSSELPEIISVCDRIYLLYDGEMKAEIKNDENLNSEHIIHIVTGGDEA